MKGIFFGRIEAGKLILTQPKMYDEFLRKFDEFEPVELDLKSWKANRSDKQNRYYWGVVVKLISDHTGYETDEVHQIFKDKFLSYQKRDRTFSRSTADLTTEEFTEYIEKVRRFASKELEVDIPDPDGASYWI